MKASRYLHPLLIILSLLLAAPLQAQDTGDPDPEPDPKPARKWLVTSHAQLSTNGDTWAGTTSDVNLIGLSDGDPIKDAYIKADELKVGGDVLHPWHSVDNGGPGEDGYNYIDIELEKPLELAPGDSLVFYTKRHTLNGKEHPLAFEVMASADGKDFIHYARIYFMYRGGLSAGDPTPGDSESATNGTKEYSARVGFEEAVEALKDKGGVKYIRLYVMTNNTKTRVPNTSHRTARLAALNVMQIPAGENYSDILIGRFRLVTDYSYKYAKHEFVPTLGIFEPRNRYQNIGGKEYNKQLKDYAVFPDEGDSPWGHVNDADGEGYKWNRDLEYLKHAGVEMTTFIKQTHSQDPTIATTRNVPGTETENWRQPTNTTEHIVYAMPGDIVPLYPFYGMTELDKTKYNIKFAHWYNYRTGGNSPYLDFLSNPDIVCKSDKYGFYVGPEISYFTKYDPDDVSTPSTSNFTMIGTVDEYIAFVDSVYEKTKVWNVKLTADLDFEGRIDIKPIGNSSYKFKGVFDGQGHTISNLKIIDSSSEYVGMFGFLDENAVVKNLVVDKTCEIKGNKNRGNCNVGLIAYARSATVSNIICRATLSTDDTEKNTAHNIGGIIAYADNVTIENCAFTGRIYGKKEWLQWSAMGGLIAWVINPDDNSATGNPSTINNCFVNAEISRSYNVWSQEANAMVDMTVKPDPYIYGYAKDKKAPTVEVSNVFSNELGGSEDKGVLKIYKGEEGKPEYFVLKSELSGSSESWPDKIDINSAAFAEVLGTDEWRYVADKGLDPFVKTIKQQTPDPVDPNPSVKKDPDEVKDLEDLLKKIYDKNVVIEGEGSLQSHQYQRPAVYAGISPLDDNGNLKNDAYLENHHKAGAAATFFCPRNTDVDGVKLDLPKDPDTPDAADDDFLIAADLSTFFTNHRDVNVTESEIYEPVVLFRHIFRIRDGKKFAEEFSGDTTANKAYVDKHRKIMTASSTGGAQEGTTPYAFQIRLEEPAPMKEKDKFAPPSNLYYKITNSDYRRVRAFDLEIVEIDVDGSEKAAENVESNEYTGEEKRTPIFNVAFEVDNAYRPNHTTLQFYGEGSRMIENTLYRTAGGEGSYSRMVRLTWTNSNHVKGKKFRLRLYAKDINDERIVICGGTKENEDYLVVQEFDIDFIDAKFKTLDDALAVEKDENGVITFKDDLEAKYGKPVAQINFDQYANLMAKDGESLKGVADPTLYFNSENDTRRSNGQVYFKWPASWRKSTYGFGYTKNMHNGGENSSRGNLEYNYDIYVLASHSSQTPWHKANDDLYDVTYYRQEKQDNPNPQKGFFFWMNSASDPCVAANLEIGQLCVGSSIHVSAYMAEFSDGTEKGNLSFNFMAVDKSGNKTLIHTYNTGYLTEKGKWFNIQYDFMPDYDRISKIDDIDHFVMQLENNCKNSEEADYAIDDIQLFVVAPEVEAKMMNVVCDDKDVSTDLKISLTYEEFLAANGLKPADDEKSAQTMSVYYSFFNKDIFDKFHSNKQEAYDASLLKYDYNLNGETNNTYGKLQFSTYFQEDLPKNPVLSDPDESKSENLVKTEKAYYEIRDGRKYVVIFLSPKGDLENTFVPGQEYYIGLKVTELETDPIEGDLTRFDLLNGCSSKGSFKIEAANNVKIEPEDGSYKPSDGKYCVGSSPTVKIDINAITGNDKIDLNKDGQSNASIDWYAGSVEEFNKEKMADGPLLSEVLAKFREAYPNESKPTDVAANDVFTEAMKNYLVTLSKKRHIDGRPMMTFATVDYRFHPGKLIATTKDSINYATAIPYLINKAEYGEEKGYTFCDAPIEVRIKVSADGPSMFHGLDIDYPDEMIDVPIRIGLAQIKKAKDNSNMLRVPVLKVNTPSLYATKLKLREIQNQDGADVLLLESNDPVYSGRVLDETAGDDDLFLTVGHIVKLDAKNTDGEAKLSDNAFYVIFDEPQNIFYDENGNKLEEKKKFEFHEGYYYTMKFDFEQTDDKGTLEVESCPGQHIFTIKVVPEYLLWVGKNNPEAQDPYDGNLNWNNDANWQRLNEKTIVPGLEYTEPEKYTDYETQKWAYAPMDFTKVVIGAQKNFPRMYHVQDVDVEGTDNPAHKWSKLPDTHNDVNDLKDPNDLNDLKDPKDPKDLNDLNDLKDPKDLNDLNAPKDPTIGAPTPLIHYDMVAYDKDIKYTGVAVACRPWYANTAQQINFRPNSEIFGQQHLRYEKAWVEMEMKPDGWYTAASPLQGVVAGDMYLPTAGARQENQFFTDITFDNKLDLNDRFRPAVYQRSWNLGSDKIYEWDGTVRDGFVKLDWSNVYNDVQVAYSAAEGFSIRTDVSEATKKDGKDIDKVLFRFPKADTKYTYYDYDRKENDLTQTVTRTNPGRLNPTKGSVNIAANESSFFFLVGNPFMAHLDILSFLEANKDKVEQMYWILNSDNQKSVVLNDGIAVTNTGEVNASTLLPPLAGFMVKAMTRTDNLTLQYDESMMQVVDVDASATGWLKAPATRGAAPEGMMLITATTGEGRPTAALLSDGSSLLNADADLVIDPELNVPAIVYTVAHDRAMAINSAADMHCTELGVVADGDSEVTIRFEGPLCDAGYYLNDRERNTGTPITEGMEYRVNGESLGVLYISDECLAAARTGISLTVVAGEVIVSTAEGRLLDVNVCSPDGKVLKSARGSDAPVRFRPGKGVIIVDASDGTDSLSRTIII